MSTNRRNNYPNGYLPKIDYYVGEVSRITGLIYNSTPNELPELLTQLNYRIKRLEYFVGREGVRYLDNSLTI